MRTLGTPPGISVALIDQHGRLRTSQHGWADLAAGRPVREDTTFEIGSISKSFTAIVALQLHERGKLDLAAPVSRYIPWLRIGRGDAPITIHELLSHTSGIIRGADTTPGSWWEAWRLRDTEYPLAAKGRFWYSNLGYQILGYVLEAVLDRPYHEIIQTHILDPLGMIHTRAAITHDARPRLATGYQYLYDDRPPRQTDPLLPATWLETAGGDGGIVSTAADLAAYVHMLLNAGCGPGGPLLSRTAFDLLTRPVVEARGGYYGYGMELRDLPHGRRIGHNGGMVGFRSCLRADLGAGFGVAILMNGPISTDAWAWFALDLLAAAARDEATRPPPPASAPLRLANAGEYAGRYRSGERELCVRSRRGSLVLDHDDGPIVLEPHSADAFFVPHASFDRFLLRFGRVRGLVVEAFHGGDWYTSERFKGPSQFRVPRKWLSCVGHYRSHNPWVSNFRVVLRKGQLILVMPQGDEELLAPLDPHTFRVGAAEYSPERLSFDTWLDGSAQRATLSGCSYYRFFTP
jgi:CubicO group peptidase (beta-lactamase class C family)